MDVIFRVQRKVEVDDVRNAVHINPAGGNVRGDEDPNHSVLEVLECAEPLCLGAVRMESGRSDAVARHLLCEPVGTVFGTGEDKHHVHCRILQ
jgi:hypothetical protein